jgi:hypothetical protein
MVRFGLGTAGIRGLPGTLVENILKDLNTLVRSSQGLSIAAHCLCDVD